MGNMSLSRRCLLTGASATAALGALGSASVAQAKAPPLNTPAPAFYRFALGSIEATVVSDGPLSIGDPILSSDASMMPRRRSRGEYSIP